MVEPVGPKSSFPIYPQGNQLNQKARVLSKQIQELHTQVSQMLADPSKVDQTEFLYQMADCIKSLQPTTLEAKKL